MRFSLLDVLTKSSSLLLNMLDNDMTFFCNSLPRPNTYFNICFQNIVIIYSFLSDRTST